MTISYNSSVALASGKPNRGNILGNTLLESNLQEAGLVRVGIVSTVPLSESGILVHIPFKLNGNPGDHTLLQVGVTTANSSEGKVMKPETIDGSLLMTDASGTLPGDSDGDSILTAGDALAALKMSVKLIPEKLVSDVDRDGKVTSNDARLILMKVVGK